MICGKFDFRYTSSNIQYMDCNGLQLKYHLFLIFNPYHFLVIPHLYYLNLVSVDSDFDIVGGQAHFQNNHPRVAEHECARGDHFDF